MPRHTPRRACCPTSRIVWHVERPPAGRHSWSAPRRTPLLLAIQCLVQLRQVHRRPPHHYRPRPVQPRLPSGRSHTRTDAGRSRDHNQLAQRGHQLRTPNRDWTLPRIIRPSTREPAAHLVCPQSLRRVFRRLTSASNGTGATSAPASTLASVSARYVGLPASPVSRIGRTRAGEIGTCGSWNVPGDQLRLRSTSMALGRPRPSPLPISTAS